MRPGRRRFSWFASLEHCEQRRVGFLRHRRDECRVTRFGHWLPFTVSDDVELIVSDGLEDEGAYFCRLEHARKRDLRAAGVFVRTECVTDAEPGGAVLGELVDVCSNRARA